VFGRLASEQNDETNWLGHGVESTGATQADRVTSCGDVHRFVAERCETTPVRFTTADIAAATGGQIRGPQAVVDGASIDTRSILPEQLFVPIVAERDGHDFIAAAAAAGARVWLTSNVEVSDQVDGTAIVVEDTIQALADLGRAARRRHTGPVIGITGSVGKTSVKDLARAALGSTAHASDRSFNNELGVPLTLCNAPDDAEYLVLEMGSRGVGHIAHLCSIAQPTVGVVTYVGAVHTSEFGDVETVAKAKAELITSLDADGTAILNVECEPVAAMASQTKAAVITYGVDIEGVSGSHVAASNVATDQDLRPSFVALAGASSVSVELQVHGVHQVSNALAALAICEAVGMPLDQAAVRLGQAQLSPWRMELGRAPAGATIINDAYNANAISTAAALRSLAALPADRRVAVLGVMAELGDRHDRDHQAMTQQCDDLGIELIAFREPAYGRMVYDSFDEVRAAIGSLGADVAVLVKGSRVAGLESLAGELLA